MTLKLNHFLKMFAKRWYVFIASIVFFTILGYFISSFAITKTYQSESYLTIDVTGTASVGSELSENDAARFIFAIVSSDSLYDKVSIVMNTKGYGELSPETIKSWITVSRYDSSNKILLAKATFKGNAKAAQTLLMAFNSELNALLQLKDIKGQKIALTNWTEPTYETQFISPNINLYWFVIILAGIVITFIAISLYEFLNVKMCYYNYDKDNLGINNFGKISSDYYENGK